MMLPRTLSNTIDKIARTTLGKDWGLYGALLEHWAEIVGPEYARQTTPVKITFPPRQKEAQRSGGTLVIRIPKGLAMEFTFKIAKIQERITAYFGYEAISKIVCESAYVKIPEPTVENVIDADTLAHIKDTARSIDDEELRGALEAFGEAVAKVPRKT